MEQRNDTKDKTTLRSFLMVLLSTKRCLLMFGQEWERVARERERQQFRYTFRDAKMFSQILMSRAFLACAEMAFGSEA